MALRRGQLPPADAFNEQQRALEASENVGGAQFADYGDGKMFLPPESDYEETWLIIFGQGSSSSSQVSQAGGSSSSPPKSNRYSWNQGMVVVDSNGMEDVIVNPSGLYGTSELNPAIEIQGRLDVPEGTKVRGYLSPTRNAWHFTYAGPVSTSSSPLKLTIDCGTGNITVGNPSSSSSSSSTNPPSSQNPQVGGVTSGTPATSEGEGEIP